MTYRKYQDEDWPMEEFSQHEVTLVSGNTTLMKLAERGTLLGNKLWVREIRKLTLSGHQTSIITTDYSSDLAPIAASMFARWCQENYFRYMRQHYGLDKLASYDMEEIPETTRVINPAYGSLDGEVRKKVAKLSRKEAEYGAISFEGDIEPANALKYQDQKTELQETIILMQKEVETLKAQRKKTNKHILISELPEDEKFSQLGTQNKHLLDTIKMIAYRAETAMVQLLREYMSRSDDARSLVQSLYSTEADLIPDKKEGTLTVCLHHQANQSANDAIRHLCEELNATETNFPGTELRMIYKLGSN